MSQPTVQPENIVTHAAATSAGPGSVPNRYVDVRLTQTVLPWWAPAAAPPEATGTPVAASPKATGTPVAAPVIGVPRPPTMIPPSLLGVARHSAGARRSIPAAGDDIDHREQAWRLPTGYREAARAGERGRHIVITAFGSADVVAPHRRILGNANGAPLAWREYLRQFDYVCDATYGRDRSVPGGRDVQPLTMYN
jgi:hypothetical protein